MAVGLTPRDVDQLSLAELSAAIDGWKAAHCPPDKPEAPSDEWFDAEIAKLG